MNASVKSIVEVVKSQRLWVIKLLLFAQITFLSYLFYAATGEGQYFLSHEDEVINYCSSKLYAETGFVRAEGCITEDVSRIGQMNWYGPGYHVVYGSLRRIFGEGPALFIQIHFVFAMMTLALIYFLPGQGEIKLLIASGLVFTWQFSAYIFTYFPESLNLFMAMVLILLLMKVHMSKDPGKRNNFIILYFAVVLVFMVCRVSLIFWLAGLIGLSTTRRQVNQTIFIFVVGLIIALVYMRFYTAPPYAGGMQKIDSLYKLDLLDFIFESVSSFSNSVWYLIKTGSVEVYLMLSLIGITLVRWRKTRDPLLLSAIMVCGMLIAALMAFYTTDPWYFLKQSDVLVPLVLTVLMFSHTALKIKYAIVLGVVIIFSFSFPKVQSVIREGKDGYVRYSEFSSFRDSLQSISTMITETHPITILWCYNEFPYGNATEALLPFSTAHQQPILYTTNIVNPADVPEIKFKRHGKLQIDYLLSRLPIDWPMLLEVHSTPEYHLYKIIDNKK